MNKEPMTDLNRLKRLIKNYIGGLENALVIASDRGTSDAVIQSELHEARLALADLEGLELFARARMNHE